MTHTECFNVKWIWCLNTFRPRQDGRYFADDVLKCIFLNENVWISLKIPLTFVPGDPINNNPAWVQIMAWRRPGDKPLSEPMLVFVPTHICVTRPQWVKLWQNMNHRKNVMCQKKKINGNKCFQKSFLKVLSSIILVGLCLRREMIWI